MRWMTALTMSVPALAMGRSTVAQCTVLVRGQRNSAPPALHTVAFRPRRACAFAFGEEDEMAQGWGPGQGGGHYGPPAGYSYGYPPRPPAPKKTSGCLIALAVLGGLFVLGVIVSAAGGRTGGGRASRDTGSDARSDSAHSPGAKSDPQRPDVEVDAVTLWKDYQANEVAADNRYKDKQLLVSGKVTDISKDFLDDVVIKLATPNPFMNVMATMDDGEAAKAARLSKGEDLKIVCKGGGMVIGSPMLRDCVIR
jgi:hypothetical protein